ncbi:MAG: triose-phosphate isomerase [Candidatus Anoxymicrobium japonicum]|uniref:Triosephosphate isomerase n=1 Tax=Candidatus Anoxymicrobium japonicum TaxID=2013648 RepID=A0A2N3G676_9ACTN|nr:MAG: triose-phosphate isomerase [Candidatus Anoxymicrobium japonicum]
MRKPIIAGNWKMNLLSRQGATLICDLWEEIAGYDAVEVVVCPPFVDIPEASKVIEAGEMALGLGAQNMHWEDSGAYTGEVSPEMLLDLGVGYVIIGHSERRQYFGETDQGVNRKVISAIEHGITPIMCCGETLKQREAGETDDIVTNQVKRGLFQLEREQALNVVIAYEPVWAIGTGKAATASDADDVCATVRRTVAGMYDQDLADRQRIQYGGSVKPSNVDELMAMPNIDGALVGGVSLNAADFARLVRFT